MADKNILQSLTEKIDGLLKWKQGAEKRLAINSKQFVRLEKRLKQLESALPKTIITTPTATTTNSSSTTDQSLTQDPDYVPPGYERIGEILVPLFYPPTISLDSIIPPISNKGKCNTYTYIPIYKLFLYVY